jgi:hypothetical protein
MKLLFSTTESESSDEIKSLLGYVDADLKLSNLKPDIITATNEVIDIIGKKVYEYALSKLEDIEEDDENSDYNLIQAIRYPIIVNAYRLFAPSNDLSHTGDGRKMRNDEHEKSAFQWQIESDNKAQEKRYYRALDDLIKFLDNSKVNEESATTIWTIWTTSDNYKKSQKLFIRSTEEFNEFFPIQSRYLLMMIAPGIAFCENREILPRIGQTKFDALKSALQSATAITDEKDLKLIHLIKEACASYSLAWAIPRMSIQIFPEGVIQSYTSDRMSQNASKPAILSEPEAARQAFIASFNRIVMDIEELVKPAPEPGVDIPTNPTINYGDKYLST